MLNIVNEPLTQIFVCDRCGIMTESSAIGLDPRWAYIMIGSMNMDYQNPKSRVFCPDCAKDVIGFMYKTKNSKTEL